MNTMDSELQVPGSTFGKPDIEAEEDDESEHEHIKEGEVQEMLSIIFNDLDSASYEEDLPPPANLLPPNEHPALKHTSTPRFPNEYPPIMTVGPSPIYDHGVGVIDSVNVNIKLPPTSQPAAGYYQDGAGDHAETHYGLQVTVESQKAEINRLNSLVSTMAQDHQKELRLLKHQLHLAQEGRRNAEQSLEQSHRVVKERESQTQELQSQVTSLTARLSAQDQEKQSLMDRLKNAETTLRHLEEQNIELCKGEVLRRQRDQHEALEAGFKQRHQEDVLHLRTQLETAKHAMDELKRGKEQMEQHIKQLEQRGLEKAELINRLNLALEESQNQLAKSGGSSEEVSRLKSDLQRATEREQRLQDKLREMKDKLDALQSEVTSFEGLRAMIVDDLPSNDSMVQLGLRPSDKFAPASTGGISAAKVEVKRLMSKLHQSKNRIVNLEAEVRSLREQLSLNSDRSANLVPSLVEAQIQAQNAKVECEQLKSRVSHMEATLEETVRSWGESKELNAKLQETLENKKQELGEVKSKTMEESRRQNLQLTQEALERQKNEMEALHGKEKNRFVNQISLLNKELHKMRASNLEVKEQFIKVCEERTAFEKEIMSLKALLDGGHDVQVAQLREDWKKEKEAFMERYQQKLQKLRASQEKDHQAALKEAEQKFQAQMTEVESKYKSWAQEQVKANQQRLVLQYQQVLACLKQRVQQEQENFVQEHKEQLATLESRCQAQERELRELAAARPQTRQVNSSTTQTHAELFTKEEVLRIKQSTKAALEKLWSLFEGQMELSSQRCQIHLQNALTSCLQTKSAVS